LKTKKEQTAKSSKHDEMVSEIADVQAEELKTKLQEKEKEATDNYDRYLRIAAEFDNYKKRMAKSKAETIKYANEELIKDILPFMDSLDRAMEHIGSEEIEKFKEGIKLIQEQLLCCLKKHGVEKIESTGVEFDPNYHEAMMQMHSDEHEENQVINEIATGYLLHGRLLRPSKVCVCKKTNKESNDINAKEADNGE
jgi:molecular chaperone GrpE